MTLSRVRGVSAVVLVTGFAWTLGGMAGCSKNGSTAMGGHDAGGGAGGGRDASGGGGAGGGQTDAGAGAIGVDAAADGSSTDASADTARRDAAGMDAAGPVGCRSGPLILGSLPSQPRVEGEGAEHPLGVDTVQGDFNGDGKLDLAGLGSMLLGNGDGTFAATPGYEVTRGARALVAGDVDKDGKLDLVLANHHDDGVTPSHSVSVLLGEGDGTFAAKVDYPAGDGASSLALGDVDGDGDLDIVTANEQAATLSVFLGRGNGTFAAKDDYPSGDGPRTPVIGDFNGDDRLDLAVVNARAGTLSVLLGNDHGTFGAKVDSGTLIDVDTMVSAAAGDLNGDGNLDVVVATSRGALSVLLGTGNGTFAARLDSRGIGSVTSAALMDVDGDDKLDLTLTMNPGEVSFQPGKGDGTFAAPTYYPAPSSESGPAVLGDFDGDGRLDLVTSDPGGGVNVLLATGPGIFATSLEYPVGGDVYAEALGDLNGDGNLDLATVDAIANTLSVLLGNGTGAFAAGVPIPLGKAPRTIPSDALALRDLDGDGKLDIVTLDPESRTVIVLLGAGDGTFGPPAAFPTGVTPLGLALGDVNGDGTVDIATANSPSFPATSMDSTASVLLGDGHGKFAAGVDYPTGVDTQGVAMGDLDGDGKLDLVVANNGRFDDFWSVGVLRGKGDGTFDNEVEFQSGYGPGSIVLGDLNKDGNPDVVVARWDAAVSVLLGMGDGTLAPHVDYQPVYEARSVTLADVNGDQNLDIVAGGSGEVVVLLGNGDGTFPTTLSYAGASSAAVGDLNGDGRPDVVIHGHASSVAVLLNSCR